MIKAKVSLAAGLILVSSFSPNSANGQGPGTPADDKKKKEKHTIDMLSNPSGDRVSGPKTVTLKRINKIKYDVSIGTQTSSLSGISLDLPFIPAIPQGAASPGAGTSSMVEVSTRLAGINATQGAEQQFQAVQDILKKIEEQVVSSTIKNPIDEALVATKEAVDSTESLVRESDNLLASQTQLNRQLDESVGKINEALRKRWPDGAINTVVGNLDAAKTRLRDISDGTWLAANKARYDATSARIDQLVKDIESLQRNDDRAKFDEAQQKLRQWRVIFIDARAQGESYFTHEVDIGCGFTFADGKETKVKVTRKSWLDKSATPETLEVITVVCSPPLSISGGFGFSTIEERDIAFIQSTKTTTDSAGKPTQALINRFGFKNQSSFRTLPVLLLNTRLWEPNDTFSLHASAGAAVDFKGQLGTDAEFIVGPSAAFKRTLFITPSLHLGRVPKLTGGFQIGDEVPSGVDTPPIEKAWKPGFAITITFRIK